MKPGATERLAALRVETVEAIRVGNPEIETPDAVWSTLSQRVSAHPHDGTSMHHPCTAFGRIGHIAATWGPFRLRRAEQLDAELRWIF